MTLTHSTDIRVRNSDSEANGQLKNTSSLLYLEEARANFFYNNGLTREKLSNKADFILSSISCKFSSPAYTKQILNINTIVADLQAKSFTLYQTITHHETDALILEATAKFLYFNFQTQKLEIIPEMIRYNLEQYQPKGKTPNNLSLS